MNEREVQRDRMFTRRSLLVAGGQLALFSALAGRLYYLQIVEAARYATLADENRINLKLLAPPRGRIFDRFGAPLALNRENFRIVITAEQAHDVDGVLDTVSLLAPISEVDRRRVWREIRRKRSFVPIVVRDNVGWEELAKIELNAPDLPGIAIEVGESRAYPHTEAVGHLLGYVGAVSEAELQGSTDPLFELPDFRIGKNGVERSYDAQLRGVAGSSQVEVNAVGRVVRELSRNEGDPGRDLELTVDIELQEFTRQKIGDNSAAAVLLEIHTGEVLAMVSAPAFDPNLFSSGLSARDWEAMLADPKNPLANKAIAGQYAPGSTFKMTTALAALESGTITPHFSVTCTGVYPFANTAFHCWRKHGHGTIDLHGAIKGSCDCYFYEVARRTGIDRLAQMARRLGFGQHLGIDMPGERPGLIPDRDWKEATFGQPWAQGETLSCGIGQSYVVVTPLQLATMTARIANGGFAITPHVVRRVRGRDGERSSPASFPSLGVDGASLAVITRGMASVVNEPGGTGYATRIQEAGFEMAGKTGSAQTRHISQAERDRGLKKQEELPWRERDNALYVAFAPVEAPRYACAVVVEHGGHGGSSAEPIARDILLAAQKRDSAGQTPPAEHLALASAAPGDMR